MLTGQRRPIGWQLGLLFIGYPAWWLLGIAPLMVVFALGWLAFDLFAGGHLRFPRGFSVWLLFLAWAVLGVLVVQADAPLSVTGLNVNRYLTWGIRLLYLLEATVVLLLVTSVRDRKVLARVANAFAWMFVWIVGGGLLGSLLPHVDFPSLLELLLPQHFSSNLFVKSLVHPNLVENVQLTGVARPSAPFPYANVWGLNFACFLPVFVYSWCGRHAGWRRWAGPLVLVVAVVPVVVSLNRGLWLALAVAAVLVAVRSAMHRHLRVLIGLVSMVVVLGVAVLVTPLSGVIADRFSSPNSNDGRAALAERGFQSVLASPIVGYGTTRNVQGSLTSIAGGATTQCPRCVAPAFGTQGQIFLTTFCQGYVGAVFYLGFVLLLWCRGLMRRGREVTMALTVVLMHLTTFFIYSADNLAVLPIFASLGVLGAAAGVRQPGELPDVLATVRAHPRLAAGLVAAGAGGGLAWQVALPHPVTATTALVIPVNTPAAGPSSTALPISLDTVAQLIEDPTVTQAVGRAVGASAVPPGDLTVTALPNTRIIELSYRGSDDAEAQRGSLAAANGLLAVRERQIADSQKLDLTMLSGTSTGLENALVAVDRGRAILASHQRGPVWSVADRQLRWLHRDLSSQWQAADGQVRAVSSTDPPVGAVVSEPQLHREFLPWGLPVANGSACGIALIVVLARTRLLRPCERGGLE